MNKENNRISREEFLCLCGAAAGWITAAPLAGWAQQETAPAPFRLELEKTLSPGVKDARGIAVDAKDRVYVAGDGGVAILDEAGAKLANLATPSPSTCVAVGEDGNVYVGMETRVAVFDSEGKETASWGKKGKGPGELGYVTSLAISGAFATVADAGNRRLSRFAVNGDFVDAIADFQIPSPYFDCEYDSKGTLYVGHTGKHRVERYDGNGKLLGFWGDFGTADEKFSGCCNPTNLAVFPDGRVATTEKGIPRLKVYDADGKMLAFLGPRAFPESTAGMDLAIDPKNRVLLLEPVEGKVRIYRLTPAGEAKTVGK